MISSMLKRSGCLCAIACVLLIDMGCSKASSSSGANKSQIKDTKIQNVLLITVDTWRFDRVGAHSKLVKTPNIDQFAEESLHFKRAFSHNPCTLPAHSNILTGMTPLYHGIGDNSGFRLEDRFFTMAEYFKEYGWKTAAFIAAFPLDSRFGLDQGFDVYDERYQTHTDMEGFFSERPANAVIDSFIEWGKGQKEATKWFSWIHLFDPHQPYLPPKPFADEYANDLYSGEVAFVDQQLGRLFVWMKAKGIYDSTLIVLVGDHGEGLGEHGEMTHAYFAYNNTIHIPLFIKIPGVDAQVIEQNVSHTDIFPTLCQALNLKSPEHLQGVSLLGGKDKLVDRPIYFESMTSYLNRGWAPLRGFLLKDEKYIDLPMQELYDIAKDPLENDNRIKGLNWKTYRKSLEVLILSLISGKQSQRFEESDPEVERHLQSLGYLPGGPGVTKTVFLPKDDLKVLLPVQNKMLEGMANDQLNKTEDALKLFVEVIKERQDFVMVYALMATSYKKLARYEQAIDVLRQGLRSNPDNTYLLSKLGITLSEYGQPDEAIEILNKAITQEAFNPENFNFLGVALHRKGELDQAIIQFEKGLKLSRTNAMLHNNIAAAYLVKFQRSKNPAFLDQAMASFNSALDIDSKLHSALNGRGVAFGFSNQPERAMEDWYKAIAAKKDFSDTYLNLGIMLAKQGQTSQAMEIFLACQRNCSRTLIRPDRERLERLMAEIDGQQ